MGFATDAYLGYLTVSPANLGTGMHFQGNIKVNAENKSQDELQLINQMIEERLVMGRGMDAQVQEVTDEVSQTR